MEGIDFWERLDRAGECWTWAGPTDPSGYGVLKVKGTLWKAHRLAWSLDRGIEPPAGVPILQTCQNRACCRPEHLVQGPSHRRQRKARRPSGSGSLEELRPGVWQLRVSVGKGPAGTYERVTRMFEGTSTEAHKALAALVADCAAGRVVAGSETMDTLFDAWLAYLGRIGRSPNYITGARRNLDHNLRPALGTKPARKVTVAVLDRVLAGLGACDRLGGPLSAATIRQHKQILSSVFTYAWKRDLVATNPVRKVDVAPVPQAPIVEPSIGEVIALMEAAEAEPPMRSVHGRPQHRPEMSTAIWLGAVLGVREAELCALQLDDFDWAKRRARIDQSIYVDEEHRTGVHVKDTKSHKARFVALDAVSIRVALEQFEWMKARAEEGDVGLVPNPYLFSDALDGSVP